MGLDARSPRGDELTRGVRDYRPGDPRRRVHWKATARTGRLMVRETEGEAVGTLTVVVSLDQEGPHADEALRRARWYVEEGQRRGWTVSLLTHEVDGPPMLPGVDDLWAPGWATAGTAGVGTSAYVSHRVVDAPVRSEPEVLRRLARAVPGRIEAPRRPGAVRLVTEVGDSWA